MDSNDMMTDDEIIAVVTAHKEGKQIEFRSKLYPRWMVCDSEPYWNFKECEYRVAPEPRKPREWWIDPTQNHAYDCDSAPYRVHVREVIE